MPRVNATSSVERGFVSARTQTDSAYTELRGGGAPKTHPGSHACLQRSTSCSAPLEIAFA
jgi:hypothetical protein